MKIKGWPSKTLAHGGGRRLSAARLSAARLNTACAAATHGPVHAQLFVARRLQFLAQRAQGSLQPGLATRQPKLAMTTIAFKAWRLTRNVCRRQQITGNPIGIHAALQQACPIQAMEQAVNGHPVDGNALGMQSLLHIGLAHHRIRLGGKQRQHGLAGARGAHSDRQGQGGAGDGHGRKRRNREWRKDRAMHANASALHYARVFISTNGSSKAEPAKCDNARRAAKRQGMVQVSAATPCPRISPS